MRVFAERLVETEIEESLHLSVSLIVHARIGGNRQRTQGKGEEKDEKKNLGGELKTSKNSKRVINVLLPPRCDLQQC